MDVRSLPKSESGEEQSATFEYTQITNILKNAGLELNSEIDLLIKNSSAPLDNVIQALSNLNHSNVPIKKFIFEAIIKDCNPIYVAGQIIRLYENEIPVDEIIQDAITDKFEQEKISALEYLQNQKILNKTYQFYKFFYPITSQEDLSNLHLVLALFNKANALDELMSFCYHFPEAFNYKILDKIILEIARLGQAFNKESVLALLEYYAQHDVNINDKGFLKLVIDLVENKLLTPVTRRIFGELELKDGEKLRLILKKWQNENLIDDSFLEFLQKIITVSLDKDAMINQTLAELDQIDSSKCPLPKALSFMMLTTTQAGKILIYTDQVVVPFLDQPNKVSNKTDEHSRKNSDLQQGSIFKQEMRDDVSEKVTLKHSGCRCGII